MEIKFTSHAKLKMEERFIRQEDVIKIINEPEEILLDIETGNIIVTGAMGNRSGHKLIIVLSGDMERVITIIDTSKSDIISKRKERARWIKIQ
ncbi:DUF4258 domain-containing protein [Thermodesulfovibrio yellowstonii]|uniref:DUF4258 domain-containing protein n=1 Tax=Thermodesulfovibrio yellowstonii TaxID=28262 RepID=UPI0024B3267C|nr:DUF4258 domain-containing protein [Thermodesulfovibrio yellowstonii]MDI6865123.1 DUF4258 domain-containing protein [Thermodesulfovibrio yellowstonii]